MSHSDRHRVERGEPCLMVDRLSVNYGKGLLALDRISLTVPTGSQVVVLGPNGAGKTTLFKAILGLVPVTSGEIRFCGRLLNELGSARPAYVPQRSAVDWHFPATVFDVVMMGRVTRRIGGQRSRAKDRQVVERALGQVGMLSLGDVPIAELSGGQQQRVFIARALSQEAELLLLDEPFNGVDVGTQEELLRLFAELRTSGRTLLVSTHDLALARRHFPESLFLNRRVIAFGKTTDLFTLDLLQDTYRSREVSR